MKCWLWSDDISTADKTTERRAGQISNCPAFLFDRQEKSLPLGQLQELIMKTKNITLIAALALSTLAGHAQNHGYGYYKDIFMDSGICLNSRHDLPVSRFLGLSIENFVSATHSPDMLTLRDTLLQREILVGCEDDQNGVLLYPDGEPRFRVLYMNGGKAAGHGKSLGVKGRKNMQDYIANGGSYVGTCAGAYIASMGSAIRDKEFTPNKTYLNIWPGTVRGTLLYKNKTAMTMEPGNPLLKYYDFGGDMRVDSIRHNGGCFAYFGDGSIIPEGTEILMRYDYDTIPANSKVKIHGEVSTWAYKPSKKSGRVVMTGSHPEENISGDRLEFMAAMVRYAMDGNGQPTLKGELIPGETRVMDKNTVDNDLAHTAVGDRQYHHFVVRIPKGTKRAFITLEGIAGKEHFDLSLLAKKDDFAFHRTTHFQDVSLGCNKTLTLERPEAGQWYISVFCDTTVETSYGKYGTEYTGRRDVLNGVPYTLRVNFE